MKLRDLFEPKRQGLAVLLQDLPGVTDAKCQQCAQTLDYLLKIKLGDRWQCVRIPRKWYVEDRDVEVSIDADSINFHGR